MDSEMFNVDSESNLSVYGSINEEALNEGGRKYNNQAYN